MLQRLNSFLDRLAAEAHRHADAGAHRPLHIEPARTAGERVMLFTAGAFGVAMIPVAAAVPLLPIWPFALLALAAAARSSSRVRAWLSHNRTFCGLVYFVHSRPEKIFRFVARMLTALFGGRR
jgi:hypothetical protein